MKTYKILITPISDARFCAQKPHIIDLETDNLEWSMEQYQRNRQPLKWEIVK